MLGLHLLRLKMPKQPRFNVVAVLFEKERQGERAPSADNLKYCAFILSNHLIVLTYFIDPKHQINKQASPQKQKDLLRSFPFNKQQNEAKQGSQARGTFRKIGLVAMHHGIHHLLVSIQLLKSSQQGVRQADLFITSIFCVFLLLCQLGLAYSEDSDNAPSKKTNTNIPQAKQQDKTHKNTQQQTTKYKTLSPAIPSRQLVATPNQFVFQLSQKKQRLAPNKPKRPTITSPHQQ